MAEPYRLVHCTWGWGVGGGVPRMDTYFHRFFDRERVQPTFVFLNEIPDVLAYDPSMPVIATGAGRRFDTLMRLFADADIVQFQGSMDPLVCEAARLAEVPVVLELLHNIEAGGNFPNIDITVCVSDAVRSLQSRRAVTIYNGIELDDFPFSRERAVDSVMLLEVSSREKSDYHLDQLECEFDDPALRFVLCGRGQVGSDTPRVRFQGVTSDIGSWYRRADLLVVLSRAEPFGLVTIEAMASGCIPVLGAAGAFPEIVTHGKTGFLVPLGSRESVVAGINEALALRERWAAMREQARAHVEQRFSVRTCVRAYEDLYDQLIAVIGRRRAPGPSVGVPTADVYLGEAIHDSHAGRWDLVEENLWQVARHSGKIQHACCRETVLLFAQWAELRSELALAELLRRKV